MMLWILLWSRHDGGWVCPNEFENLVLLLLLFVDAMTDFVDCVVVIDRGIEPVLLVGVINVVVGL